MAKFKLKEAANKVSKGAEKVVNSTAFKIATPVISVGTTAIGVSSRKKSLKEQQRMHEEKMEKLDKLEIEDKKKRRVISKLLSETAESSIFYDSEQPSLNISEVVESYNSDSNNQDKISYTNNINGEEFNLYYDRSVLTLFITNKDLLPKLAQILGNWCRKNSSSYTGETKDNGYVFEISVNKDQISGLLKELSEIHQLNLINKTSFRPKEFSLLTDIERGAVNGAKVGGSLGTLVGAVSGGMSQKQGVKFKDRLVKYRDLGLLGGISGTILGASLGAVCGAIKGISKRNETRNTVFSRLDEQVVIDLKKSGYKEGSDFTRDPKTADRLRTKVSIVISKESGELRILVNTINDPKLRELLGDMIKKLPSSAYTSKNVSDRFNDLTISIISDSSADSGLVCGIIDRFIHAGYPVYLVGADL